MAQLRFRLLGPLEAAEGSRVLSLGGAKQRALLAVLLLHPNELVSRDRLIDELWGNGAPAGAAHNLEVYISRLRKALRTNGDLETPLLTRPGGYLLKLEPGQLDVGEFESLLARGHERLAQGDAAGAVDALDQALALWHGEPLADLAFERFARAEIERLEELRLTALETRIDAELALGRHARLVPELEALVAREPLREGLRAQLMLALYRCGRQADALALYQQTRRALVEIGLEPGQALQQLEQAILRQDPELELTSAAPEPDSPTKMEQREPVGAVPASRKPSHRLPALVVGVLVIAGAATTTGLLLSGRSSQAASIAADSVGFIDGRGGHVRSQVAVQEAPTSAAFGFDALWVSNSNARTVSRVDPETGRVSQTIPVGNSPGGIAAGGGGVWVANHDDGTLFWINPEVNRVVKVIQVGAGPTAVTYGFGAVWVTNANDRTLSRIDPKTGDRITIRTNAVGRGIAVGGGFVWVTDESSRRIVQIDPATNEVAQTARVGEGPTGIAYAAGSIWVANALDGTVSRVDATTLKTKAALPIGGGPSAVTFGDGSVWVSAEFGARVVRIDPQRGVETGSVKVGNRPQGLAAGPGGVWVAVQASGTGHHGGRLVVISKSLESIDPAIASITVDFLVLRTLYDGLTSTRRIGGSAGTQLVPDLAAALPEPSDGGKSYTFQLRQGIRYSDGRPLRAADFKRAIERLFVVNPDFAELFSKIVGADGCAKHRPCHLSRGLIVHGPSTLTVRLTAPNARLLFDLADLSPVPAGTPLRDVGTDPIPSTGPYAIDSYAPGRLLTLVRNRHFHVWSAAARPDGYPDKIVYRMLKDGKQAANRAVRDVLAGKADLMSEAVPAWQVQHLASRYPGLLKVTPQLATTFIFLNVRRPPFDDVRVRRALNYAVDRNKMVALHGGPLLARPTCQLVPPTVTGYAPYCPYTVGPNQRGEWKAPDLAKARALIAASGTKGQRVVVWSFAYFHSESRYFVDLLQQLGYHAELHYIPNIARAGRALRKTPSAQAGFGGWFGTARAVDMLKAVGCRYGRDNAAHFCNPRIDTQIARLARVQPSNPAGAAKLAAMIDREIVDRAPWIPLFTPQFADLTSRRVGNYQATPYGLVLLDQMWVR